MGRAAPRKDGEMKTNKLRNITLTIIGIPTAIVMASEVENPDYWWVPIIAAVMVFGIVKLLLGGNNEWQ